jgi:peroxidase
MRTPRAVSFLALSGLLLLLAVSVAATGYGGDGANSPGGNGYAGGHDAAAGSKGYGSGGASPGEKGYAGGGGQEGSYKVPAYQESVAGLDERYYEKSCPKMEEIVGTAVMKAVKADETLAASIIRLFFHDFAVGVRIFRSSSASLSYFVVGESN